MEQLNRSLPVIAGGKEKDLPEKVLMFGEGAFLRAFACYAFDEINKKGLFNGSVTMVQPIPEGTIDILEEQEGLYTVIARGLENGEKAVNTQLITCVTNYINPYKNYSKLLKSAWNPDLRFIVSNTTEAGISYREGDSREDRPPVSFPAKVTAFLYERYTFFKGDKKMGLVFLPCELIDDNGTKLKELVLRYSAEWGLGDLFVSWINSACVFTNTLVDRITAGYPKTEADDLCTKLGYTDKLLDACELFYFWAIEGPPWLKEELPFIKAGLNVAFCDDISSFRLRKVRLLNGAHTCCAPAALLYGLSTVREAAEDEVFKKYLEKALYTEVIPTLDLNKNVLEGFAKLTLERFSNPFIRHELQGITLNSVSKFKTRVLPTILEYQKRFGKLPPILTFSFAALIAFYKNGGRLTIMDEPKNIAFLQQNKVYEIFKNESAWGVDLAVNTELYAEVEEALSNIKTNGIASEIKKLVKS